MSLDANRWGEVTGDLLDQPVEVIVNPWNRNVIPWWLLLPQGVSGAIKRHGGPAPFRELARMGAIPAGEARVTGAGRLPYRAIIHVAGLNLCWRSSLEIVRSCVVSALALARQRGYESIAFPLIGAGTGGLNPGKVAEAMRDACTESRFPGRIVLVRRPGKS